MCKNLFAMTFVLKFETIPLRLVNFSKKEFSWQFIFCTVSFDGFDAFDWCIFCDVFGWNLAIFLLQNLLMLCCFRDFFWKIVIYGVFECSFTWKCFQDKIFDPQMWPSNQRHQNMSEVKIRWNDTTYALQTLTNAIHSQKLCLCGIWHSK